VYRIMCKLPPDTPLRRKEKVSCVRKLRRVHETLIKNHAEMCNKVHKKTPPFERGLVRLRC
jgi:hypothetical protein